VLPQVSSKHIHWDPSHQLLKSKENLKHDQPASGRPRGVNAASGANGSGGLHQSFVTQLSQIPITPVSHYFRVPTSTTSTTLAHSQNISLSLSANNRAFSTDPASSLRVCSPDGQLIAETRLTAQQHTHRDASASSPNPACFLSLSESQLWHRWRHTTTMRWQNHELEPLSGLPSTNAPRHAEPPLQVPEICRGTGSPESQSIPSSESESESTSNLNPSLIFKLKPGPCEVILPRPRLISCHIQSLNNLKGNRPKPKPVCEEPQPRPASEAQAVCAHPQVTTTPFLGIRDWPGFSLSREWSTQRVLRENECFQKEKRKWAENAERGWGAATAAKKKEQSRVRMQSRQRASAAKGKQRAVSPVPSPSPASSTITGTYRYSVPDSAPSESLPPVAGPSNWRELQVEHQARQELYSRSHLSPSLPATSTSSPPLEFDSDKYPTGKNMTQSSRNLCLRAYPSHKQKQAATGSGLTFYESRIPSTGVDSESEPNQWDLLFKPLPVRDTSSGSKGDHWQKQMPHASVQDWWQAQILQKGRSSEELPPSESGSLAQLEGSDSSPQSEQATGLRVLDLDEIHDFQSLVSDVFAV
jgi:hypothetical protein